MRRRRAAGAAAARDAHRCRHRLARRPAQRVAHLGHPGAQASGLRCAGPHVDVHACRASAAGASRAALGREPVGSAGAGRSGVRPARRIRRPIASRCRSIRRRARRSIDGWRALGVPADARVVVMHVSAGNPFRRWPEASFAALASDLVASGADRWVVLTGGPSDREAASRVLATARSRSGRAGGRIVDGEGMSLAELRALMDRAALFVGGDSGPLHVASTSDVPIVGLYGPTLPARSAPWRPRTLPTASIDVGVLPCRPCDQRVCAPGDFRCLTGIAATTRARRRRTSPGSWPMTRAMSNVERAAFLGAGRMPRA